MSFRRLCAMAGLLCLAVGLITLPATAQEQTGSIVGKVTAQGGDPLPGVTVEIRGSSGTLVTVTDSRGEYRFPRVIPGSYRATFKLSGFQTYEDSKVSVALGDRATVNAALKMSAVKETVVVTGERVQIAVGESASTGTIASENINYLPKGRDFTTVVTQVPGARNEQYAAGISIGGASGAENRFVIDGVDTTDPQRGLSGQNFVTDFLEEVQVKSAGYAAEYGGALGGVINAITKTGTNEFHGWAGTYYSNSSLNGESRPTYGESYPNYYKTFEKDSESRWEPGFGLGGPILKDSLWFYVGYNPTLRSISRTPEGQTTEFDQSNDTNYLTANLKTNLGSKVVLKASFNLTNNTVDGILPAQDGSTPAGTNLAVTTKTPVNSYSLYADYVPSTALYLTGRVGSWDTDNGVTTGINDTARIFFRNGLIPVPPTDPLYRPTGFASVPAGSFNSTAFDKWKRQSAGLDFNVFFTGAGSHALKLGVQYEKVKNEVLTGENGNLYEIRWGLPDRFGAGVKGTYGSVHVRSFKTDGKAEDTNIGLYIQDSWTIVPEFTLNIGVRTEQERVPNYGYQVDPTLPEYAMSWDFQDKLAPRIGFAWDIGGKQKAKLYGSYGNYYDITKLSMPRGSFGADKWIAYLYPLNTTNWPTLPNGCTISTNNPSVNPCPALGTPVTRDLRKPTNPYDAVDPDLQPMENREWQLGIEYQLTKNSVVSARYLNKKLLNTIEDIGYLDEHGDEVYITGNPGKGIVACQPGQAFPCPDFPQVEAFRDFQSAELTWNRRFADNWSLRASYIWSSLKGNYSGLASSDEWGRTDPNVARYFDGLVYGYDSQGGVVNGPLNTDRPHQFLVNGIYRMPWNMSAGLNFTWATGGALSTEASYNGVMFNPNGRNDMGRMASITNFDLYIAQPFQIGKMTLEASVNVLNLFDSKTIIRNGNTKYLEDICDARADCDTSNAWYFGNLVPYNLDTVMKGAGFTQYTQYGRALAYQGARQVRFAVKLIF